MKPEIDSANREIQQKCSKFTASVFQTSEDQIAEKKFHLTDFVAQL